MQWDTLIVYVVGSPAEMILKYTYKGKVRTDQYNRAQIIVIYLFLRYCNWIFEHSPHDIFVAAWDGQWSIISVELPKIRRQYACPI